MKKIEMLKIILENNKMLDCYHVGIRSESDIKYFNEFDDLSDETIESEGFFVYPDFSKEDYKKALNNGIIKVYSSKPFKLGNFISTSKMMALDYAGNGKIYSKIVKIDEIAWISPEEGQVIEV